MTRIASAFALCALALTISPASAGLVGPSEYLSFSDSPFGSLAFRYFYLEDFEDGLFNTPGVTASQGFPRGPGPMTDSVDGDDGVIDGFGEDGVDFATAKGPTGDAGIRFEFSEAVLGGLPTHAGIVWTDGGFDDPTLFEAFDAGGTSLGVIGPVHISDNTFASTTAEDRFFGVVHEGGVSAILIRNPGTINTVQVDHLQYGAVPEPTAMFVLALAAPALLRRKRR